MQTHFRNKIQHKSLHLCIIINHKGWNTWKHESLWLYFPINKKKCTSIHIFMQNLKGQITPFKVEKKTMSIFRHMTSDKIFASFLTLHFRRMPLLFTILWIRQIKHMWPRVWFIYRKCIEIILKKGCVSGSSDRVAQCVSVRSK